MGHSSKSMEDSGAKSYLNCQELAPEVSEEKKFSMMPRDCSFDILVKNADEFYHCLKHLPETKEFGLIPLAEEISKPPFIGSVLWLLVLTLMKIYNEKEQAEKEKL